MTVLDRDEHLSEEAAAKWRSRLMERVDIHPTTGCWIWQGYTAPHGYGKWRGPGWDIASWAHRNAWFIYHGPIPEHLEIDHLCYRPACVNVEHMELVTPEENQRRATERRNKYREAAPIVHGATSGYARGCECRKCLHAGVWGIAEQGSRIVESAELVPDSVTAPVVDLSSVAAAPTWMADAACAESDDDLWTIYIKPTGKRIDAARAVCERCPVLGECLNYAIETQPDTGVWGGVLWSKLPNPEAASDRLAVAS